MAVPVPGERRKTSLVICAGAAKARVDWRKARRFMVNCDDSASSRALGTPINCDSYERVLLLEICQGGRRYILARRGPVQHAVDITTLQSLRFRYNSWTVQLPEIV